MAIDIPLKEKYLVTKPSGFKSHSNHSGKAKKHVEGLAHRRVNAGPFWHLSDEATPINWPTAEDWRTK